MNEKLKELAEQAGFEITPWGNESLPCVHQEGPIDVELTKFAQLIVRECIQVCADRGTHHDGLYSAWAVDCSERIGKHFGVEEQTESQKMAAAGYTRRPRGWTKEE
jgi:hypothetical protein